MIYGAKLIFFANTEGVIVVFLKNLRNDLLNVESRYFFLNIENI